MYSGGANLFQFYDSAIKRQRLFLQYFQLQKFQFYDSAIKRVFLSHCFLPILCFNSTIVRLKGFAQFARSYSNNSFNSTIVRLKVRFPICLSFFPICFNSTIVRLKVSCGLKPSNICMFQFYNSAIKRASCCRSMLS